MPDVPDPIVAALPDCRRIEETHISWVLLTDAFAFKVKKPVTLPFLDYATVEKRRACCEEELRINRRFAPDLYLEVVDLAGEPAVKMRRFDAEARLDRVCALGDLTGAQLSAFARDLADLQSAAAVPPAPTFGAPETVLADALENFAELKSLMPVEASFLAALEAWTQAEFAHHAADFARRRRQGRIREGHGDLHLGNLALLDGRIVPFDAIEFNARFRCIDVASEIAFTLLDLLEHGRPGLAGWLLSEWLDRSGDHDALTVLRFYLVYRAMVRAKVAALQGRPEECARYLAFARRLAIMPTPTLLAPHARKPGSLPPTGGASAWGGPTPTLTITCGPSGSGKTWASSRRLATADFLHTVRIRSDVERKRLFGFAPEDASDGSIYTPAATLRTYAHLGEIAERAIGAGWSVIVDAAFLKRAERDAFRRLAARLGVPFAILAPTASPDEMRRRLAARQGDASEATPDLLDRQLVWFEPIDEAECDGGATSA